MYKRQRRGGVRELGLRPSIYIQAGALFGITRPLINTTPFPVSVDPVTLKSTVVAYTTQAFSTGGLPLYSTPLNDSLTIANGGVPLVTTCATGYSATIGATGAACAGHTSVNDVYLTQPIQPFKEVFGGDSARPRISVGAGFNWNSPFGPLRIDVAYALLKDKLDDTKLVTFNVGTQF